MFFVVRKHKSILPGQPRMKFEIVTELKSQRFIRFCQKCVTLHIINMEEIILILKIRFYAG